MLTLEAREYGPDSTPAEIEAIQARLYILRPGVVMYREVPAPSPFQIGLFADKLRTITAGLSAYAMVMDLTGAKPPGGRCREALRQMFADQHALAHVAVFTGGNFIINGVAKLLLKNSGVRHLTMCKDEAEALATLAAR
ncbi:hypothetical protein [Nannocystis radixulma]|uniref:STAS domain-containing protein n=1 Tax=Nannocystis radixulma TaxID=2995305 RepID=A0ABT5BCI8_9BACT|nr:hypothetical protein [Nannocystis radixulma]MDC0671852.1 hypothetical protein [Nannocystis radixulma]